MDPYETLGVDPNATEAEVKKAYRSLMKRYHPDKNGSDEAKDRVRQINAAYEILSDAVKRAQYQHLAYAESEYEEDPIETYKREFQRKRWEKEQAQKARHLARLKRVYRFVRRLTFPILFFAILLILDDFLPGTVHEEIPVAGWQERLRGGKYSRGQLASYIETPNFYIRVPHRFHLNYPYYSDDKPPVKIFVTPLFKIPRKLECAHSGYRWSMNVQDTIHTYPIPLRWILLVTSLFVVLRNRFTHLDYALCFLPALFFCFVISVMS